MMFWLFISGLICALSYYWYEKCFSVSEKLPEPPRKAQLENLVEFGNGITEESHIQSFYKDSSVFITGATGFLGKLIVEKLLWSCRDIRKIYVMIRSKKDKDSNLRFMEIFDSPIFKRLKLKNCNFIDQISFMVGDCSLPNLGLSDKNLEILKEEVDCIFHCAASVRFNSELKIAVNINMRSTRDLLWIAKEMKQLRSFVHVSTAYSHCILDKIDESFYPVPLSGNELLKITDMLDDSLLGKITPILLGDWPNTYAFTKALAEDIIKVEGKGLPIAIVRPSIIVATAKEPMAGWIDNMYGATGIIVGIYLGMIHSINCYWNKGADIVPADYVVNSIITAAWEVGLTRFNNNNNIDTENGIIKQAMLGKEVEIYNYVSTPQKSINWGTVIKLTIKYGWDIPSPLLVWLSFVNETSNLYLYKLSVYIFHYLPAYIMDFIATAIGKKTKFIKNCNKFNQLCDITAFFTTREWKFSNNNIQTLWKRLTPVDRELFDFDMNNIDWDTYFYSYIRGCRVHVLKDPFNTIPLGKIKQRNVRIAHYTIITLIIVLLLFVFLSIITLRFI